MIDFGCKRFELNSIIKCALGLTKAEVTLFFHLLDCPKEIDARQVAQNLNLNITTVQKAFKKFHDKGILVRRQKNLDVGGYIYVYTVKSRAYLESLIMDIIKSWTENVRNELRSWRRDVRSL